MTVKDEKNTKDYEFLLDLIQNRSSIRSLKSDPIPQGYTEKVVEAGRWAMSGANSQPWEFIIVRDPEKKKAICEAYKEVNIDYAYWMEQQRIPELRHPSFHLADYSPDPQEQLAHLKSRSKWHEAPEIIVVIGDGRRQWGTVMAGHTFGRDQTHLTDGLANCCQIMHLTAASLGLGTQWITVHIQDMYKKILDIPDIYTVYLIIPIGYPAVEPKRGVRRELSEMVHYDGYDQSKYLSNEQILQYIAGLRGKTVGKYRISYGEGDK
ncbi:nitroreductase family protein [Robertmurraya massiliosenegalensis]|uniref:nitroreductase family protein n=1 Tax=Robertmurraya TaxID=2837507 RepID=UPI0039A7457A